MNITHFHPEKLKNELRFIFMNEFSHTDNDEQGKPVCACTHVRTHLPFSI